VVGVFLVLALVANALAGLARVARGSSTCRQICCASWTQKGSSGSTPRSSRHSVTPLTIRPDGLISMWSFQRIETTCVNCLEQLVGSAEPVRFENRVICKDGSQRWVEWSVVWHRGLFYAVGRDVTVRRYEQDQLHQAQAMAESSRDRLRELAEQQAGLRRVATLVALGASPSDLFAAVADEMAESLHARNASINRFEGDEVVVLALSHLEPEVKKKLVTSNRHPLEGDNIATRVLHTRRARTTGRLGVTKRSGLYRRTPS